MTGTATHAPSGATPDYSRQMQLKEIGAAGQARLGAARVLVVGLGGLGCPVVEYLAGAGVGTLGLVESDRLEASNLHRQPLYSLADVGRPKIELARERIARLNPAVRIESHPVRLTAANALELIRAYDLVVDGSDNFRTKFLINDAAVLAARPAVFASVYQYEGQLQVYRPRATHACLRCLWPEATADGIVGNCAEAGVLGPVPGAFGALEALIALRILLDLPGDLAGELLLFDGTSFTATHLKAPRRAECHAPECARIRALAPDPALEVSAPSWAAATALADELIDVRTPEEIRARPSPGRAAPMAELLAGRIVLEPGRRYLLLCASGQRSLATAAALAARGLDVRSLAGGLQGLEAHEAPNQASAPCAQDRSR